MKNITLNQAELRITDALLREQIPRGVFGFRREDGDLIVVCAMRGRIHEYPVRGRGDTALMMTVQQIAVDMGR